MKRVAAAVIANVGISALTLNGGVANAFPLAPPPCPPGQTCPGGPGGSGGQGGSGSQGGSGGGGGNSEAPKSEAPAPKSQAPETQAPQTQAPQTQAPETQAPKSQAPETQAPASQPPASQAPEHSEAPKSQPSEGPQGGPSGEPGGSPTRGEHPGETQGSHPGAPSESAPNNPAPSTEPGGDSHQGHESNGPKTTAPANPAVNDRRLTEERARDSQPPHPPYMPPRVEIVERGNAQIGGPTDLSGGFEIVGKGAPPPPREHMYGWGDGPAPGGPPPHWEGPPPSGGWDGPPPPGGWNRRWEGPPDRDIDHGRQDFGPFQYNTFTVVPVFNWEYGGWGYWFFGLWVPLF
nr:MAP_0585 family protein [Mycobacterium sp. OTB74]